MKIFTKTILLNLILLLSYYSFSQNPTIIWENLPYKTQPSSLVNISIQKQKKNCKDDQAFCINIKNLSNSTVVIQCTIYAILTCGNEISVNVDLNINPKQSINGNNYYEENNPLIGFATINDCEGEKELNDINRISFVGIRNIVVQEIENNNNSIKDSNNDDIAQKMQDLQKQLELLKQSLNEKDKTVEPKNNTTTKNKNIPSSELNITSNLDNKRWYLIKLQHSENLNFLIENNAIWVEFNTFMNRCNGFGACNNFEAVIQTDLESTFNLSKVTNNTGYVCRDKKVEDLFFEILKEADRYEIKNNILKLYQGDIFLMDFSSTPKYVQTYNNSNIENTTTSNSNKSNSSNRVTNSTIYEDTKPIIDDKDKEIEELKRQLAEKKQKEEQIYQKKKQDDEAAEAARLTEIEKQKEIEELKRQLAEKKQLEEEKRIQAEQDAIAVKKKQEAEAAEAAKQAEIEKQKAAKQKEIEDLKRQLAEKEKELNGEQPTNTKTTTSKPSSTTKTKVMTDDKPATTKPTKTTNNTDYIPEPEFENIVYFLKDKNLYMLDRTTATFKGSTKDSYLELPSIQSSNQYNKNTIPKLYIKLTNGEIPNDIVFLHICDFKKEKRIISLNANKNTVDITFKKVSSGVYEIILPSNLETNEFAFITKSEYNQLGGVTFNTITAKIACFGIEENNDAKSTTKINENTKPSSSQKDEDNTAPNQLMPKMNTTNNIPEPEFENTPYYYDKENNQLIDLDADQYVEGVRPKGLYGAEKAIYINGYTSNLKIDSDKAYFIIKLNSTTDPRTLMDLTAAVANKRSGKREAVVQKKGAFTNEGVNNVINISIQKLGNGKYIIYPKETLGAGEYFFSLSQNSKILYSFTIK